MQKFTFGLIAVIFFALWWRSKKKWLGRKSTSSEASLKVEIKSKEGIGSNDLSEFQQWLLNEEGVNSAEELDESLKKSFKNDDWSTLEPTMYAKWSKFYWGI